MLMVLVTGSNGFVGRNLCVTLARIPELTVLKYDVDSTPEELDKALAVVDVIFHLAGVNRPKNVEDFKTGNADFTKVLCDSLLAIGRTPLIVLSSSVQAALDNPYGASKRQAEIEVEDYARKCASLCPPSLQSPFDVGSSTVNVQSSPSDLSLFSVIFRLPNVFGKWCRPNYNSAVATWCHNIANDLPIQVRDPEALLTLVYVDDVVNEFLKVLGDVKSEVRSHTSDLCPPTSDPSPAASASPRLCVYKEISSTYTRTLGQIADLINCFKASRADLQVPDQGDGFSKKLYATYLSYLPADKFSYPLKMNVDARGSFTEILKTPERGQVSVNISKPHVTKGNHWHHTKNEKFLVVSGRGVIRFRKVGEEIRNSEFRILNSGASSLQQEAIDNKQATRDIQNPESRIQNLDSRDHQGVEIIEYHVSGDKLEVVDIPPGYTHNIENLGDTDMVTVMWACEALDHERPDTFFEKV
jgi:UDP-2-acetamido-2,6-beta-L-arabino-hexul-4-ose reductase